MCADTHRNLLCGQGQTWTRRHQHEPDRGPAHPVRGPAHPLPRGTSPSRLSRAAVPSARAARSGCNSRPPQPVSHTWSQTVPGPVALSPSHTPSLRGDVQVGPWKEPPGTRHPGRRSSLLQPPPSPRPPVPHPAHPITHQPRRRADSSAASRPGQPKGRRGPGGRFRRRRRRRLSSAQPHRPRPAPAAAGRSGSRRRRHASRLGLWGRSRRSGAPGRTGRRGVRAPLVGACGGGVQPGRARTNKGARRRRPAGEEGGTVCAKKRPPAVGDEAHPLPAATAPGHAAGRAGEHTGSTPRAQDSRAGCEVT